VNTSQQNRLQTLKPLDPRQPRKLVGLCGEYDAVCTELLSILTMAQLPTDNSATHANTGRTQLLWIGSTPSPEYQLALSNRHGTESTIADQDLIIPNQAAVIQHLGTEHELIVFDASRHFDANAFAAICGTLVHSGRLYLLTPKLKQWSELLRHQSESDSSPGTRFGFLPDELPETGPASENVHQQDNFLKRFIELLCDYTRALPVQTGSTEQDRMEHRELTVAASAEAYRHRVDAIADAENVRSPAASAECESVFRLTSDQQTIMDKLLVETEALSKHIWLITADRGRGKSALLGMLLAELQGKSDRQSDNPEPENCEILISGPSKRATQVMYGHFQRCFEKSGSTTSHRKTPSLNFCPPDELLTTNRLVSLLIIDEAAAIPLPMLKKLLAKFPRIILATTVHGYEGAGRGFEIRLGSWLQYKKLAHQWLSLGEPVRWLPADRLEQFCNQAFLLNAKIPEISESRSPQSCYVRELSGAELSENEPLLISVFALLVQAHYQTKPMDLQHLLDGANLRIFVLQSGDDVIGVAWLAAEGPFSDDELKTAIVRKQRRPHGHLLPQLLSQWTGQRQVLDHRLSRIVRLAIHPRLQRQGFGSFFIRQLSETLDKETSQTPLAGIGALFAAEPGIVEFWKKNGFQPFHLGTKENRRSGLRSIAMLRTLNGSGLRALLDYAVLLYSVNFHSALQSMPAYQPAKSANKSGPEDESPPVDSDRLVQDYIKGYRSFENTREFIRLEIEHNLISKNYETLNSVEKDLLDSSLEIEFSFVQYAKVKQMEGKKQVETLYRSILKKVLSDI